MVVDKPLAQIIPSCSHCGAKAVVELAYASVDLCSDCFNRLFEKRVWKANRKFKMFTRGERVAVGVSGGKDSSALLFVLSKMAIQIGFEIIPVLVDEGIHGYRNKARVCAEDLCKRLGLELKVYSYKDAFGKSMDEIMKMRNAGKIEGKSCSFCGVMRRKCLEEAAIALNASKIALGHNADDIAQTFLMNFLRGEPQRNERFGVVTGGGEEVEGLIPRVRPLVFNTEKETAEYCVLNDLPFYLGECPYAVEAFRGEVKNFLNATEEKYPGTKFNLLHSFIDSKQNAGAGNSRSLGVANAVKCSSCGSPSSSGLCKACEFKQLLSD